MFAKSCKLREKNQNFKATFVAFFTYAIVMTPYWMGSGELCPDSILFGRQKQTKKPRTTN